MLLCADADAASADLASGALACPSCGAGWLRPWGHGRERVIRLRFDAESVLTYLFAAGDGAIIQRIVDPGRDFAAADAAAWEVARFLLDRK